MKRYFVRSVKYLVALVILYVGLMAVMHYSHPMQDDDVTFAMCWQAMFSEWNGWGMVIASIVLAATYPFFGYVKRTFEGDIVADREQLNRAADFVGLELVSESTSENGVELVYHAKGLRRLVMLFEDTVRVRQCGSQIEVEGLRRVAVRMAFDAERYITNKRRDEA